MAAMTLLAPLNNPGDEEIKMAISVAKRTAELIDDGPEDKTPKDTDVEKIVRDVLKLFGGKVSSKTQLVNAIRLKGYDQIIAEYIVNRAEAKDLIIPHFDTGNRTYYTLA